MMCMHALTQPHPPLYPTPQIKIKTLTSRFLTFDVEPTMTVLQLKHLVQDKEAIDAIQIRLIYKGQQLFVSLLGRSLGDAPSATYALHIPSTFPTTTGMIQ